MNYGPYHRELKGPARFQPVEIELGNDILLARECACAHSDPHDFSETCRHFRLYLLASIALIEAYLNRYALLAPTGLPLQEKLDTLRNSQRFDERIITWMEIFTDSTFASVSATSEYDSFIKLKRLRNDLVHSSEPFLGYRLKDMAMQLNLCRKGVGGFLSKLHLLSGREPLSFMDKLITAPRITYAKEHK